MIKKQSGTIIWLNGDSYYWESPFEPEFEGVAFRGQCNFNGTYKILSRQDKLNYYVGGISKNGKEVGKIFLYKFVYDNQILFKGDWEDDTGKYPCFIHLY